MEFGESFEDCARRETSEETTLILGRVNYAAVTNDIFPEEGKHYITVYMRGEYLLGEPKVVEELIFSNFSDLTKMLKNWFKLIFFNCYFNIENS